MYHHVSGRLSEKSPAHAVIEAAGVGYFIRIPASTYRRLPETGNPCTLFVVLMVRDDALDLCGFGTLDEKRMFVELTRISGIGAQLALSVLSALDTNQLVQAIEAADVRALCRARGVGRKLAQRMILELKGALVLADETAGVPPRVLEAEEALVALGYSRREARERIEKALKKGAADTVEALVRAALR